jgi:DNA polymerase-3 subunit epsilon
MLNREIWPMLGVRLPQQKVEVSSLYYEWKNRQLPPHERGQRQIDLRFATMMNDLELPLYDAHDALNDAVMAGLAFVKLRALLGAGS